MSSQPVLRGTCRQDCLVQVVTPERGESTASQLEVALRPAVDSGIMSSTMGCSPGLKL